jgi:predicted ATPase/class 3 adenylate cyclase
VLPIGTVTLLFSDIEGSTRMLDRLGPAAYGEVLAAHQRLLRGAWGRHGGVELLVEGDAFFVVFERAADAVAAAADAQAALDGHTWPAGGEARVRMGLHTGEAEVRDGTYIGLAVHYAARLCDAAHGGQVLLSETTRALADAPVHDLGEHRLKDFPAPRRLFHLVLDGHAADAFPPPRTLDPIRTNLPVRPALIGRETDLARLARLCREGDEPLLTLVGSGGTGKTALAVAAGHAVLDGFPDGVFLVSLEGLVDPPAVPDAIARTLGLLSDADVPARDRLVEHLRGRRTLLVLDNFEHLLDAAPGLTDLTAAGPDVRLLVTSQSPLRVRGERVVPLGPLELPLSAVGPEALARVPSVALLVARAEAVAPGFALTEENAVAVGDLCTLLDGVPLALELAAARLSLLEPADLLARVARDLAALGHGGRDLPPRQQGLPATLNWTTSLLSEPQRRLLRRASVFAGGFSVALADAVSDGDALDDLVALRDASLVRRSPSGRLALPPPVRVYARHLLAAAGEEQDARRRHAHAVLALVEPQAARWLAEYAAYLADVELEAENIREALRWAVAEEPEIHRRLFVATARWFSYSGRAAELEPEADRALAAAVGPRQRAEVLTGVSALGYETNELEPVLAAAEAWRALGDSPELVDDLYELSNTHVWDDDPSAALAIAEEARDVATRLGDPMRVQLAEAALAQALWLTGRVEDALAIARPLKARARPGSFVVVAGATTLADAALEAGEPAEALGAYAVALGALHGHHPRNIVCQLDGIASALAALERDEDALLAAALGDLVRREFAPEMAQLTLTHREAALAPTRGRGGPDAGRAAAERAAALGLAGGLAWAVALGEHP